MKNISPILYIALILAIIFAVFHFVGQFFYFYWIYWWYDVIMHFFAGVVGGFAAYGVLHRLETISPQKFKGIFSAPVLSVIVCVVIVGVLWEVLEYVYDFAGAPEGYVIDTTADLILDTLGAALAVFIGKRIVHKNV